MLIEHFHLTIKLRQFEDPLTRKWTPTEVWSAMRTRRVELEAEILPLLHPPGLAPKPAEAPAPAIAQPDALGDIMGEKVDDGT